MAHIKSGSVKVGDTITFWRHQKYCSITINRIEQTGDSISPLAFYGIDNRNDNKHCLFCFSKTENVTTD